MKCSKCKYFVKTKLHGTTCGCQGVKPCEVERKRKERNKVRNKKKRSKMEEIINGKALYSTKGAAMEYGRVGCNFYTGCPHDCLYCYLKRGAPSKQLGGTEVKLKKCFKDEDHALEIFCREVRKYLDYLRQVGIFFSFTTDPLIPETRGLTFSAINMCIYNQIPVKILTKNATFVDYHRFEINTSSEIFKKYVSIGFTLTGRDDMEPKASTNEARIEAMERLKKFGFQTWASIEPVVDWASSRNMVRTSLPYCDHFKIGLRSGVKRDYYDASELVNSVSWLKHIILEAGKTVYFKESIRKRAGEIMGDKWIQTFLTGTLNMDGALIY